MLNRYIKNIDALSEKECNQLRKKRVCVVGCGGLGGYVISNLARIGVENLTIVDCDVFEETNLNRQIFSNENNLGKKKVDVVKENISTINSSVKIVAIDKTLNSDNTREIIAGHDCIVDCLDNFKDRFWLAHACEQENLPIIYGAIAGWYGQVSTIFPGDVAFVDIYGSMEDGTHVKDKSGNLSFTAASVASVQACECVKVLLNHKDLLRNKILMVDMYTTSFEIMILAR